VAPRAIELEVRPGQGKLSFGMVELRSQPCRCAVADRTILRKTRSHVIGIGGLLEVGEVARGAVSRSARESPVRVALHAGHSGVSAGKRKTSKGVVIEIRSCPTRRRVA